MLSLVEFNPVVLEKNMFKISSMYFSYLVIISLERGHDPSFTKLVSPSSNNTLFKVWLTLAYWFLRGRFLNFINVFRLFAYCWKRAWPVI